MECEKEAQEKTKEGEEQAHISRDNQRGLELAAMAAGGGLSAGGSGIAGSLRTKKVARNNAVRRRADFQVEGAQTPTSLMML